MNKISFFDQIEKNKRNSIFLIIFVFFILVSVVYAISSYFFPTMSSIIIGFAVFIMVLHAYTSYNYGDKIVLSATRAQLADKRKYAYLTNLVDGLSIAAGIPKPKAYVIESSEMNAFATGKNPENASIAVTTALLENLNRKELEGVIGHEMSHIKNYDIRFAMLVAVFVGLIAIISDLFLRSYIYGGGRSNDRDRSGGILIIFGFLLAIFAPIIVRLTQAMVSRQREYLADASSAQLTRYPEGLASALEKISKINKGNMKVSEAVSHIFFVDPRTTSLDMLFATHPDINSRIRILRAM